MTSGRLPSGRLLAVLAVFLALHSGGSAAAANFLDVRYDEDSDELVVALAYRGTNPDHGFSIEWGSCEPDQAAGSFQISARVLDSQWNDLARRSFHKTVHFGLHDLRCRPALITLFTAPQVSIGVRVPAKAGADRSLRGPRTDAH